MNILFVGHIPPFRGGAATADALILKALALRGNDVRAIGQITPEDAAAGDWFAASFPQLKIRRFPVPYYILAHVTPPAEVLEQQAASIREIFDREIALHRPDVVLLTDISGAAVIDPSRAAAIPTALVCHGGPVRRLRSGDSPAALHAALEKVHRADHIIAVAEHLKPLLTELGLHSVDVIPNIADMERFFPRSKDPALLAEWEIPADALVVAHFSNLKAVKRPLDFVHAAKLALERNPRLLFVVGGDGDLRAAMEDACAGYGIAGQFRFPGWLRSDRMPDYYSVCDIVVLPSEMEALAMVYLETQACGRVLIASDIPAAREVIEDGVTGLLFPMGSVQALAETILTAATSEKRRQAIGQQARSAAEARTMDRYGEAYERALLDLVSRGPKQDP